MKKFILYFVFFTLPFLLVWCAWFLTAMSFDTQYVFTNDIFWGISVFYYLFILWFPISIIADDDIKNSIYK